MSKFPLKLEKRLQKRKEEDSFRELSNSWEGSDFSSNDYLGFAKLDLISELANELLEDEVNINGSTGSRLLSGNHSLFKEAEQLIADFHNSEAALIYNSGYDANIGFFSSVLQKSDLIFFDEYAHASIRDGLKMSLAKAYKFKHNDLEDLELKLKKLKPSFEETEIYVVTESVFSMDGDSPDLKNLVKLSEEYGVHLIIDEAHATGVFGENGRGLLQELDLERKIFARINTFGKAIGCHGAVVLGSAKLRDYLVNFSRSFIYTTALSPHSVASVFAAYRLLDSEEHFFKKLKENILHFKKEVQKNDLKKYFIESNSAIQSCIISGNPKVKEIAARLNENDFIVKPILSPTVPVGKERLRFCLHSYNSTVEISEVLKVLGNFVEN